ncbi:hypothetical protein KR054_012144 [Drosophila jambulina]|nr:hypothetical protein KR054_012144 [Drosophila jambulina]
MSGLKKFQDNEAWRQKLRAYLLTDCSPKKPGKIEEKRYSREMDGDLRKPLEARTGMNPAGAGLSQRTINLNEDTIYEGAMGHSEDADDSFDAFEKMCDKTGSDPDSTLFQYLHSENRSQVMAMAKDRSASTTSRTANDQMEIDALRRMLEAVGTEDMLDNESPVKGVECTQLEDVEAPSRFWDNDNTLAGTIDDSVLEPKTKVSPVKMVGLLRPSTIIEDNELETSGMSSLNSFLSARTRKTNASSCYETATDSSLTSGTLLNVDDLFHAAIAKAKPPGMSKGEEQELLSDLHGSLRELALTPKELPEEANDQSDGVIDDTIIELSSDDDNDEEVQVVPEIKQELSTRLTNVQGDETTEEDKADDSKEDKENVSLHFNDTMEEIQYMMEKGMEFINNGVQTPLAAKPKSPMLPKQSTFVVSPSKTVQSPAARFLEPALPLRASNKPKGLEASPSKGKPVPKHDLNMEWSKKKFFGVHSGIPQLRNIVSPIRAYTQKSGTAPLMSLFRPTSTDIFSTLAISELEQESRLCQLKPMCSTAASCSKASGASAPINGIDSSAHVLPKKAYISSEIKHVVDERTPIPMPNVPQIQKYLNTAVEPTVLRHDGKMKMPNSPADKKHSSSSSHIPRRANHSLADLSLASGDVSLYTIRDAQKF